MASRKNTTGFLRQVEDVWFWVGRLTAELTAVEDSKYDAVRLKGAQAIIKAQQSIGTARPLLIPQE